MKKVKVGLIGLGNRGGMYYDYAINHELCEVVAIVDFKLKPGVVNVLVDYVLKTYDKKLTRARVETIAGEWSRNKIETVEEAMDIAKKNHKSVKKKVSIRNDIKTKEGFK